MNHSDSPPCNSKDYKETVPKKTLECPSVRESLSLFWCPFSRSETPLIHSCGWHHPCFLLPWPTISLGGPPSRCWTLRSRPPRVVTDLPMLETPHFARVELLERCPARRPLVAPLGVLPVARQGPLLAPLDVGLPVAPLGAHGESLAHCYAAGWLHRARWSVRHGLSAHRLPTKIPWLWLTVETKSYRICSPSILQNKK